MQIIDGKLVAKVTREQIKQEVEGLKALNYPNAIGLAVILVGDDPASQVYVRNKIKACDEVGIKSFLCKLPAESLRRSCGYDTLPQRKSRRIRYDFAIAASQAS